METIQIGNNYVRKKPTKSKTGGGRSSTSVLLLDTYNITYISYLLHMEKQCRVLYARLQPTELIGLFLLPHIDDTILKIQYSASKWGELASQ